MIETSEYLTIVGSEPRKGGSVIYTVRCRCGNILQLTPSRLKKRRSCGCATMEICTKVNITHGMTNAKGFRTWEAMISRCYKEKDLNYHNYGGRGITVCERWKGSFVEFYKDMGPRPDKHSIERINNNGNYEPGNCKWATMKEQGNNRRNNIRVKCIGLELTLWEWSKITGISVDLYRDRVKEGRWDLQRIILTPKLTQEAINNKNMQLRLRCATLNKILACKTACGVTS